MERRLDPKALAQKLKQFKYPALVLLLGLVLILWPSRDKLTQTPEPVPEPVPEAQVESFESQLERILSCIDGAGQVRVLLSRHSGDETVYQVDETLSRGADSESRSAQTVMADVSGGSDSPVVRQTVYGQYRGALIVCQGADSAQVRLELVNAVAGLTGLSTDRITVIKMKG